MKNYKNNSGSNEKLQEALEKLENGVSVFQNSKDFKNYLKTISKFHNYSINNSLLIYLQKPDATQVAGFQTWKSLGRFVKSGEKGITILAPAFGKIEVPLVNKDGSPVLNADGKQETEERKIPRYKPATTFDYSQTDGKPLPKIATELKGEVKDYDQLFEAVKSVAESGGVQVEFENIQSGAKGYFSPMKNRIAINMGMSQMQSIKTLLHELTHSKVDGLANKEDETLQADLHGRETRAEACAFVCCDHFGIDCSDYTFPYLSMWSKDFDLKEFRDQMDNIRKVASEIIKDTEKVLGKEDLLAEAVKEAKATNIKAEKQVAKGK